MGKVINVQMDEDFYNEIIQGGASSGGQSGGEGNDEYCLLRFRGAMGDAGVEVDVISKQIAYFAYDTNTGKLKTFNSFADFISAHSELRGNSVYPIQIDFDNKIIIVQNFTKEFNSASTDITVLCNSEIIGTGFINGGSSYNLLSSFIPLPSSTYIIEDTSTTLVGEYTSGKLVKVHDIIKKDSGETLVTIYMYQGEES